MDAKRPGTSLGWRPQTRLVRGGLARSEFGETAEAIYLTSGYVYDDAEQAEARFKNKDPGYIYSRYGNPTVTMFEERMCLLEGAAASRAVASGMAAVNAALMCQVRAGDRVVASRALFGSCRYIIEELLPRYGVTTTLVDGPDLDQWRAALKPGARCVFIETPANPTLELIDIRAVAELAHAAGARLIVDNVFATPVLQKPLPLGTDIVVYSTTKHIDGQGRCLGGVVLGTEQFISEELQPYLRHTGPSLSPFNAWVMVKGLETLELRVRQHCANAAAVADFLAAHPAVSRLLYPGRADFPQHALAQRQMPGGGSLVTFDLAGDKARVFRFLNALGLIDISNNLGDAKSLITHPATTTHQRLTPEARAQLGITDSMVRLSVGLEDPADIIEDLDQALAA
ncbi:MAG TPA: O-succinylhomoserine sulfhydrylase [Candidatus Acidoferrum sp.]|nr:O-succinylhomoserine sulfhydrylase [Candidatus Acidoferrum sp.]